MKKYLFIGIACSILSSYKSIVPLWNQINRLDKHNPQYTPGCLHNKFNSIFISCGTWNAFARDLDGVWENFIAVMCTKFIPHKYRTVLYKFFN